MSRIDQVVILAGGLGTRLRPITEKIPKPLVEVRGHPFLYWQLLDIEEQGFEDVVLLAGHLGEQIEDYINSLELDLNMRVSIEPKQMGTGGAIVYAKKHLDDHFVLLNGDSFLKMEYAEMVEDYFDRGLEASLTYFPDVKKSPVPSNLKIKNDLVLDYQKNGGLENGFEYIDSGVYVLNKELFTETPEESFSLESLWKGLIAKQKLGAFLVNERFYDIGTSERLKLFEERLGDYFPDAI
ncbi:MAG: sugar phosphate nucleotidyltransferase [Bdellovibrionales bacterium]